MRIVLVIILLAAPALSQLPSQPSSQLPSQLPSKLPAEPSARLSIQLPSKQLPLWSWSDAALAGAMFADEGSTAHALNRCPNCRELGIANPGLRIGLKAGVFGFFKAWEYKKPEDRGKTRWIKLAVSGLFVGVAIHNMGSKK